MITDGKRLKNSEFGNDSRIFLGTIIEKSLVRLLERCSEKEWEKISNDSLGHVVGTFLE